MIKFFLLYSKITWTWYSWDCAGWCCTRCVWRRALRISDPCIPLVRAFPIALNFHLVCPIVFVDDFHAVIFNKNIFGKWPKPFTIKRGFFCILFFFAMWFRWICWFADDDVRCGLSGTSAHNKLKGSSICHDTARRRVALVPSLSSALRGELQRGEKDPASLCSRCRSSQRLSHWLIDCESLHVETIQNN